LIPPLDLSILWVSSNFFTNKMVSLLWDPTKILKKWQFNDFLYIFILQNSELNCLSNYWCFHDNFPW
jgi:hypothetical protein